MMAAPGVVGVDLSCQEAPIKQEGEIVGAAEPTSSERPSWVTTDLLDIVRPCTTGIGH